MDTQLPEEPLERLARATNTATRAALLDAYPALGHSEAVKGLCDLVTVLLHVDLDRAFAAAGSARWLSSKIQDPRSLALSTRALGNVLLVQGESARALDYYSSASQTFHELSDFEQVANTHLSQISALLTVGDTAEALHLAEQARAIFSRLNHDLGIARLENNLGILYLRQEDLLQARLHWQEAYKRFLALGQSQDAAIALRNLAVAAISANNYQEAVSLYRKARAYCESQGLKRLIHEIDYNIAYLYFLRGDYEQALRGYQQARARSHELGDLYHAALCDLDETELYLELNLLHDAVELADRAIGSFRQLQRRHEIAKALAFRGIAASRLGDPRVAVGFLRNAHAEFAAEGNHAWASLVLLYEALVFQHEGRLFEARRAASDALTGFRLVNADVKTALCHLVLAQLALSEAHLAEAAHSCDTASTLLAASDLPPLQFQALFTLGEIQEAAGRPVEAARAYKAAEALLQAIRSRVSTEELRLPLLTNRLEVYDRLLGIAAESTPDSRALFSNAFRLAEKSKARSLSDLLASRSTPVAATTPARSSLVDQVRSLREELNWYYKRFAQTDYGTTLPSTKSLQALKTSMLETERKLARSLAKISKTDLELGSLHQALTVALDDVRTQLKDDELILEYFVGQNVVFLLSFSKSLARCDPIAVPGELDEIRRLLEFQLSRLSSRSSGNFSAQAVDKTLRYLHQLYTELIGPVEDLLTDYSRLTIIPHSFLFYFPFSAFLDKSEFLGDRFRVSFAPSASSLFFSRKAPPSRGTKVLAFAGPEDQDVPARLKRDPNWQAVCVAANTDQKEWRAHLEKEWALIHLPLAASYRQDNPVLSSIQICDDRYTVLDLFSLPFRASVLVATGCGHLPGRIGNGDEIVALSRSLLYSGPQTLVVPLWQPRRSAEVLFLDTFYSELASGTSVLEAVATAQRSTRAHYSHPGDWAAWVPFGA